MLIKDSRWNSRAAIMAVVLFLVFDFTALALNYWLSWKIEKQAVAINLSGRQRMLSQRMAKVLLQLEGTLNERGQEDGTAPLLKELRVTFTLFDDTLKGFAIGHRTLGGANEERFLEAVTGTQAQALVREAAAIWAPYREQVLKVLLAEPDRLKAQLPAAVGLAEENNLKLLDLMNRLTTELEILTQREAAQIRLYQGIAFLLALLNFFGAFFIYARRVRDSDKHQGFLTEIIDKVSASVMVLDGEGSRIIRANQTSEKLFGHSSGELNGKKIGELLETRDGNLIGHRKDGTTFMALQESSHVHLDGHDMFIETISDVTEQRMTEVHLSSLAYHDLLTSLPNRLLFDDRLRIEIEHAQRGNRRLGVLFIDLDRFKPVNDEHGHDVGDLLLQDVAVRLKRCLRDSDTISRRGGDEFTVIVNNIGDREHCAKVAQIIISQIEKPFVIQGLVLHIGASVGIALFPEDGDDAHLLLSRADEAMYRAKQQGRGIYRYYSTPSVGAESAA